MRTLYILAFIASNACAQAIYDANGQYKGYSQTSPSGVTTIYSPQGQSLGSSQIDNGQTNYYSPNGAYRALILLLQHLVSRTLLLILRGMLLKHL
jgi:hypothetical protein